MIIALPWISKPYFMSGKSSRGILKIDEYPFWLREIRCNPVDKILGKAVDDWCPMIFPATKDEKTYYFNFQYPVVKDGILINCSGGKAESIDDAKEIIDRFLKDSGVKLCDNKLAVMI